MDRNRVTVRYARALLELSQEQKLLEKIDVDMRLVFKALIDFNGFNNYIVNPGLPSYEKFKRVNAIFQEMLHPLTVRFLDMVFSRGREEFLKDICRNFVEMSKEARGMISAKLIMADDFGDEIVSSIAARFEQQTKSTIEMETLVNKDLIGGFVFTIDGWQYDASIASKLKSIKKQLQLK